MISRSGELRDAELLRGETAGSYINSFHSDLICVSICRFRRSHGQNEVFSAHSLHYYSSILQFW